MDVASSLKALVFAADIPAPNALTVNHAVNVEQTLKPELLCSTQRGKF